jgi:3',5'-cyclic-AMP phosphodiesterase
MTKPFLLVQLSDPHIGATWADGDPVAGLRAAVEAVRRLPDDPDAVLMSGDLADNAADGEYDVVRELLAQLGAPAYVLPGNHDDRATLRRHFDLPGAVVTIAR